MFHYSFMDYELGDFIPVVGLYRTIKRVEESRDRLKSYGELYKKNRDLFRDETSFGKSFIQFNLFNLYHVLTPSVVFNVVYSAVANAISAL